MSALSFPNSRLQKLRSDLKESLAEFVQCKQNLESKELADPRLTLFQKLETKIHLHLIRLLPLVSRNEFNSYLFWPGRQIVCELQSFPLVAACLSFCDQKDIANFAVASSRFKRVKSVLNENHRIEEFKEWMQKVLGQGQFVHYKVGEIENTARYFLEQLDPSELCSVIRWLKEKHYSLLSLRSIVQERIKICCAEGNLAAANELMGLFLDTQSMTIRKIAFCLRENCGDFAIFQNLLSLYATHVDLKTLEVLVSCFSWESSDPILKQEMSDCFRTILIQRGGDPLYRSERRGVDGSVFHVIPHGQRGPEGSLIPRGAQEGPTCWYEIAQRMFPLFKHRDQFMNPYEERRQVEVIAYTKVWTQYYRDWGNDEFVHYQDQLCLTLGIQDRLFQSRLEYLEDGRRIPRRSEVNCIVHNLIYRDVYYFQHALWNPAHTFEQLLEELPLIVEGWVGREHFDSQPYPKVERWHGQEIYGWRASASIVRQGGHHAIMIKGGKKSASGKEWVYFVDPRDGSDPENADKQRLYRMPYQTLRENVVDLMKQHGKDVARKPFAYHARTRPQLQRIGNHCDRYLESHDEAEITQAIAIAETLAPTVRKDRLEFILTKYISHTVALDFNSETFRKLISTVVKSRNMHPFIGQLFENTPEGENRDALTRHLLRIFSFEHFPSLTPKEYAWVSSQIAARVKSS